MQEADPSVSEQLQLVLAGRLDLEEERLIAEGRIGKIVRHLGTLSRAQAMALQRRADVLVLLTSPTLPWELPGKVFEYFGARRPILALAENNEAASLIEETGTGWTVPPDDAGAIAERLHALLRDGVALQYDDAKLEPYVYPAPVEALEREIERALAGRRATA